MTEQDKNRILLGWLKMRCANEKMCERLRNAGYSRIAVCGYREYGRLFVQQLLEEGMAPVCIIEKNYQSLQQIEHSQVPIVGFLDKETIEQAEVIIAMPDIAMPEIREDMEMADLRIPVRGLEYFVL